MKRFYTLALGLMMGATTLFAQKTTDLQFVTITGEGDEAVETGTVKEDAAIDKGKNDREVCCKEFLFHIRRKKYADRRIW